MGWFYLATLVGIGTAIWPIGRWVARNGDTAVFGFWVATTGSLALLLMLFFLRKPLFIPGVWISGILGGLAGSVGFYVLMMGALKVGPMSLTIALNNMAMLFGVLYSTVWIGRNTPGLPIVAGITGVSLALVMIGTASLQRGTATVGISRRWLVMVVPGSAFSALSFIIQTHVGNFYPDNSVLFAFCCGVVSSFILRLLIFNRKGKLYRQQECRAGIITGLIMIPVLPLMLNAIHLLGAEIALPVAVASPIILTLLLGHYVYHEKLSRKEIIGCIIGALSVAMLSC